jgi:crotonobetainyl-CoA:carnitine CoA-transferase CaiB-like acyl-CoA transferase
MASLVNEMGPLNGVRIIELGGIGPVPFGGMVLADLGAEVILIERKSDNSNAPIRKEERALEGLLARRGKKSVCLDLKQPAAVEAVLRLVETADALIEGFRPGVAERLGVGPDICLQRNARLVYGRQTGWGQTGPLSQSAGHDINYVALAGALYYTGRSGEVPFPPPTILGDVAGGALVHIIGILAALRHAEQTGEGQVIDAAVTDGATYMMALIESLRSIGQFGEPRGTGMLSGEAPWYQTYECADGEFVTVGALEPAFYRLLCEKLGVRDDPDFSDQFDTDAWPRARDKLESLFLRKSREEWCRELEGTDVCFAPVLSLPEAQRHPHNERRGSFVTIDGRIHPAPAPKFDKTPTTAGSIPSPGEHTAEVLGELGLEVADL